jgi:hypothetical protein
MDKQNINTKYTRIHAARRLKDAMREYYSKGKSAEYTKVVRKYNALVKELS